MKLHQNLNRKTFTLAGKASLDHVFSSLAVLTPHTVTSAQRLQRERRTLAVFVTVLLICRVFAEFHSAESRDADGVTQSLSSARRNYTNQYGGRRLAVASPASHQAPKTPPSRAHPRPCEAALSQRVPPAQGHRAGRALDRFAQPSDFRVSSQRRLGDARGGACPASSRRAWSSSPASLSEPLASSIFLGSNECVGGVSSRRHGTKSKSQRRKIIKLRASRKKPGGLPLSLLSKPKGGGRLAPQQAKATPPARGARYARGFAKVAALTAPLVVAAVLAAFLLQSQSWLKERVDGVEAAAEALLKAVECGGWCACSSSPSVLKPLEQTENPPVSALPPASAGSSVCGACGKAVSPGAMAAEVGPVGVGSPATRASAAAELAVQEDYFQKGNKTFYDQTAEIAAAPPRPTRLESTWLHPRADYRENKHNTAALMRETKRKKEESRTLCLRFFGQLPLTLANVGILCGKSCGR
eukprot:GHVT01084495.1.p1 GENE.GHVT01084495.1~~GHVT01084495.1.p1  ORF type:complete len:470 (+),score=87.34 GHVT01084495.1:982-2391(+)